MTTTMTTTTPALDPRTQQPWDTFAATMTMEGALGYETEDEATYLGAVQYLVDTGIVWSLQGWFGRTAEEMIERGVVTRA